MSHLVAVLGSIDDDHCSDVLFIIYLDKFHLPDFTSHHLLFDTKIFFFFFRQADGTLFALYAVRKLEPVFNVQ